MQTRVCPVILVSVHNYNRTLAVVMYCFPDNVLNENLHVGNKNYVRFDLLSYSKRLDTVTLHFFSGCRR